jgi:hypothetical protein
MRTAARHLRPAVRLPAVRAVVGRAALFAAVLRFATVLLLAALLSTAPSVIAQPPQASGPAGERPACVAARSEARMQAYGFDHLVTIDNRCEATVSCRVSTDVDPAVIPVSVPARETRDTLTRRGSPARAFTARVDCDLR